ncbi:MAG: amino acid transporter, partial [Candidatus Eiseniibacteriota bacterium]
MEERPQDEPDYSPIPEPPAGPPPPEHFELRALRLVKSAFAFVIGPARALTDPQLFHKISLAAFLAWVGLGADGLSSSAYGPDAAFRALHGNTFLAIPLAILTAITVVVIAASYMRII